MKQVVDNASGVRLAELVASLSFAIDLGRGLPMEHSIRRALLKPLVPCASRWRRS